MTERIKLTEEQIEVWICGVYINLGDIPTENKTKPKQLKQQILDDQEKVDTLEESNHSLTMKCLNYQQENKQLNGILDHLQMKYDNLIEYESKNSDYMANLKQKLEKIKMFFAQYTVENGEFTRVNVNKLKKIL